MFLPDYQSVSDPQVRSKYEAVWQFHYQRRRASQLLKLLMQHSMEISKQCILWGKILQCLTLTRTM